MRWRRKRICDSIDFTHAAPVWLTDTGGDADGRETNMRTGCGDVTAMLSAAKKKTLPSALRSAGGYATAHFPAKWHFKRTARPRRSPILKKKRHATNPGRVWVSDQMFARVKAIFRSRYPIMESPRSCRRVPRRLVRDLVRKRCAS